MGKEASVLLTLRENYTAGIEAMRQANKDFGVSTLETSKKLQAYDTRLQALVEQQGKLSTQLVSAKKALKDAEKAFKDTGDAANAEALNEAQQKYEALKVILNETTRASKMTQNAMRELEGQGSRMSRQSGGSTGGIISALGQAGAWSQLGDVASQWANTLVGSAFGSDVGTLFSSALAGAGSGAAIGSMIAPGVGTAVGAGVGALVGLIGGGSQIYENQDQAFKEYYQQLYEQGQSAAEESLTSGSATASQRELDKIAFNRLLGDGVGTTYLSNLRTLAAETPMEYSDLTGMSRALATGFGDSPERMLQLMRDIGDAGSAVGVTAQDMTMMAQAMSRMQGSGKASLEYLNILQERGVNVIQMLADAYGKTQSQIYDMISKGEIKGGKAVDIIQAGMESMYGGAMETMAQTFEGLTSTLSDAMTEIDAARGQGYNETRKFGLQDQVDAYGGELGAALTQLNRIAGQNEAYMENLSEQYTREALEAVLLGKDTTLYAPEQQEQLAKMAEEYNQAKLEADRYGDQEARLTMENLYREAQSLATIAYESSDAYLKVHESELDLIESIRTLTASFDGWSAKYAIQQELSKGQASVPYTYETEIDSPAERIQLNNSFRYRGIGITSGKSSATGLRRVPYNDFPAVLHEDERVLTAAEARVYNKGGGAGGVTVSGNTFIVRQESDIDAIAASLLTKIRQAGLAGAYG